MSRREWWRRFWIGFTASVLYLSLLILVWSYR